MQLLSMYDILATHVDDVRRYWRGKTHVGRGEVVNIDLEEKEGKYSK